MRTSELFRYALLGLSGVLSNNAAGGGITSPDSDAAYDFTVGCDMPASDPGQCLQGSIDEVRASNVIRSANWLRAEYLSISNSMNSFGSEETGGSIAIGFHDNTTPAHGATLGSVLLTGSDAVQTYQEQNPTPSNPNALTVGQQGEWDFSLDLSIAPLGTYYFRMAKSDGTPLTTYTNYPTLIIQAPPTGPTLDQQLRGGGSVVNGVKGNLTW